MKMDRNINEGGMGKYALSRLRHLANFRSHDTWQTLSPEISGALATLANAGILDWGYFGTDGEFFVIRMRDENAQVALLAYADSAERTDPEWAAEVRKLAKRAGPDSPFRKQPD